MRHEALKIKQPCPKCDAPLLALSNLAVLVCGECGFSDHAAPELKRQAGQKISREELHRMRPDLFRKQEAER